MELIGKIMDSSLGRAGLVLTAVLGGVSPSNVTLNPPAIHAQQLSTYNPSVNDLDDLAIVDGLAELVGGGISDRTYEGIAALVIIRYALRLKYGQVPVDDRPLNREDICRAVGRLYDAANRRLGNLEEVAEKKPGIRLLVESYHTCQVPPSRH